MPPLAPHGEKSRSGGRQRQEVVGQRSASFHGRGAEQRHQLPKQRPKTQPDLLAGLRGRSFLSADREPPEPAARRTPSKVLVSVAVQRSLWPLHVMASAEWSVADLVAAAVGLYVKEGRRPLLPSIDPSAFGLHYSQFSLESTFLASAILHHTILWSSLENASLQVLACLLGTALTVSAVQPCSEIRAGPSLSTLARRGSVGEEEAAGEGRRCFAGGLDPRERVMELGSRSFFLCPKSSGTGHAASSSCTS